MEELRIPITYTGRKYGYITWREQHDVKISKYFGNNLVVELHLNDKTIVGKLDWKKRRIWITYKITRKISDDCNFYLLSVKKEGDIFLSFV